ncbi:MAG: hypothetical protein LBV19_00955 [Streptococcaceae bacterium]|jgi:hypothetical protein|nr:hypothetical protein [Streptococcaceae bacterium]
MNIPVLLAFLTGSVLASLLFILGFFLYHRFDENRYKKELAAIKLHLEVEVRRNLNSKIIEILNRPVSETDRSFVDPREDVKVAFADYHFLKNYTSLHNLYIPVYFMDQFFKNLSNHLAVFEDEDDLKNGGYIFRDSRRIFEDFSVVITDEMEAKKAELENMKNVYPSILRKQYYKI